MLERSGEGVAEDNLNGRQAIERGRGLLDLLEEGGDSKEGC